jgi:peptidoglycan/LPS O-acetylase OafA/YrhL
VVAGPIAPETTETTVTCPVCGEEVALGARSDHHADAEAASGDELTVVPSVDGWRGIAVLAIVVFHCWIASGFPAVGGRVFRAAIGQGFPLLDYLFVISGFVMFLPVARRAGQFGNVKSYALRRVARLVPAYYLCLFGIVVLWPYLTVGFPGHLHIWTWPNMGLLLVHLVLLQAELLHGLPGLHSSLTVGFTIDQPLWTLSIEGIFYALLPILAARYYRRPLVGLLLALGVQTGWRAGGIYVVQHWKAAHASNLAGTEDFLRWAVLQFPGVFFALVLGMAAARAYVAIARGELDTPLGRLRRYAPLAAVSAFVLLAGLLLQGGFFTATERRSLGSGGAYYHYFGDPALAAVFAALLVATALSPRWMQWPVANPLARWLGHVSYGTYLWHMIALFVVLEHLNVIPDGTPGGFFKLTTLTLLLAIACGWLSYRFVEQPSIRWAKRRITRSRARRAGSDYNRITVQISPSGAQRSS